MEVIVPAYDAAGRLAGLSRPARFRLEAGEGCQTIGNPIRAGASAPTQVVFFCGDRFLRVPLKY
jgi:hypothetical protein